MSTDPAAIGNVLRPRHYRRRPIFLHFLDVHYFGERSAPQILVNIEAEADLAIRLALIVGSEILIPAAALRENPSTKKLLEQYSNSSSRDMFFLVGGGSSLPQFVEEKLEQYPIGTVIGDEYRSGDMIQPFPWRSRKRSSTSDIHADWINSGSSKDIIRSIVGENGRVGRGADREWFKLPQALGKRAFTPENAWTLLPSFHGNFLAKRNIYASINTSYFKSYLRDVTAGIFQRLPWLSGGIQIESLHPDLDIDFSALLDQLRDKHILDQIRSCPIEAMRTWFDDSRFIESYKNSQGYAMDAKPNMDAIIVVAATQELNFAREYFEACGVGEIKKATYGNRSFDLFSLKIDDVNASKIGMTIASDKGKSKMKDLLDSIEKNMNVSSVIMIGMMAGIKGKSKLLDVISPRSVYDGTAIGTKDGKIVSEPEIGNMDPVLHHRITALDRRPLALAGINLVTHKKTVTVSAKIDDITHELAASALSVDPENVIGLEMEASALCEKQDTQRFEGRSIQYLMIKGVADYGGGQPDSEEMSAISKIIPFDSGSDNADPTNSPLLKTALQREATRRSLDVTVALIRDLFV